MFSLKRLSIAAVAAAALAVGVSSASADTITFNETGAFGTTGGLATYTLVGTGTEVVTITYTPTPHTDNVAENASDNLNFGQFALSVTGDGNATLSDSFFLQINQVAPLPGGDPYFGTASVSGTINISVVNGTVNTSFIKFTSPLSVTVAGNGSTTPNVTYAIQNADDGIAGKIDLSTNSASTINGKVSVATVPLPAAAWGGMSLLGLLGAAKARSRRQNI